MAWNPAKNIIKFSSARLRPAMDLMSKAAACTENPGEVRTILDLGCGAGLAAEALCTTFPNAKIEGVDKSIDNIEKAIRLHEKVPYKDRVSFRVGHTESEAQFNQKKYDLIFSNSSLHWELHHERLIPQIIGGMLNPNGGVLAVQMPDTRRQPSHTLMDTAALRSGMFDKISAVRIPRVEEDPSWYFELLSPLVKHLDMWSSEYCQQLRSTPPSYLDSYDVDRIVRHPVIEYTRWSGLRPLIDALGGEGSRDCQLYLDEYERLLVEEYPLRVVRNKYHSLGKYVTLMPFKRFFFVCKV